MTMNVDWNNRRPHRPSTHSDPVFARPLAEFRDPAIALANLGPVVSERGTPALVDVVNVWYIPMQSLQAVYRLQTADGDGDAIVRVRFFPRGESAARYRAARDAAASGRVTHLPEWSAVAWLLPEDPGLATLPAMFDHREVAERLSRHLGRPLDPAEVTSRLLSYLPEERCSMLYHLGQAGPAIIGKLQRGESAARGHRVMSRLWSAPARGFTMPRPVGLDADLGARWETCVAGRRVTDLLVDMAPGPLAALLARTVPRLHALALEDAPPAGAAEVLRRLHGKALARIRAALPSLADEAAAVVDDLAKAARALPDRAVVTIHGDLHAANVLIDGDGVALIDLDRAARGDPAHDLALFASRMLLIAVDRETAIGPVARAAAGLPDTYAAASGHPVPGATFAWYMAAMLLGWQMRTCIRHYAPRLDDIAPTMLRWARAIVERGRFDAGVIGE